MALNKRERVLEILQSGGTIRFVDGRYKDEYVDMSALKSIVDDGLAEKFLIQGMTFIRKNSEE